MGTVLGIWDPRRCRQRIDLGIWNLDRSGDRFLRRTLFICLAVEILSNVVPGYDVTTETAIRGETRILFIQRSLYVEIGRASCRERVSMVV